VTVRASSNNYLTSSNTNSYQYVVFGKKFSSWWKHRISAENWSKKWIFYWTEWNFEQIVISVIIEKIKSVLKLLKCWCPSTTQIHMWLWGKVQTTSSNTNSDQYLVFGKKVLGQNTEFRKWRVNLLMTRMKFRANSYFGHHRKDKKFMKFTKFWPKFWAPNTSTSCISRIPRLYLSWEW
jgi:hypothetical protein